MPGLEQLAATAAAGDQLNNPGRPWPVRLDVHRCFLGPQRPRDVTAVPDLVMRCGERDLTLPQQLAVDLPLQDLLIGFDAQDEVGPLLRELSKNALCVWSASAWISTPSRSSAPRSFLSSVCSLLSRVA